MGQPAAGAMVPRMSWCTEDPDEATNILSTVYAPHALTVKGGTPFSFSLETLHSNELTVGFNRFDTEVCINVPPPARFYTLCYAPDGCVSTTSGDRSMVASATTATILHPDHSWTFSHWSQGSWMMCIRIDRTALEEELGVLLGRPVTAPLDFGGSLDLRDSRGQEFARVLELLRSSSGGLSGMTQLHPVIADRTGQLLTSTLLLACEHNYSESLQERQSRSGLPAAVRRVVDAVERDPMQVLSAVDAARIAHLSVRAVERAFEQHVGVSPMRFARNARLARARADLLSNTPEEETVLSIAARWGFGHAGRFATLYERRYGEKPSMTLRR